MGAHPALGAGPAEGVHSPGCPPSNAPRSSAMPVDSLKHAKLKQYQKRGQTGLETEVGARQLSDVASIKHINARSVATCKNSLRHERLIGPNRLGKRGEDRGVVLLGWVRIWDRSMQTRLLQRHERTRLPLSTTSLVVDLVVIGAVRVACLGSRF